MLKRTLLAATAVLFALPTQSGSAQAPGKWPPDSLVNTQVIPRGTSVTQVWGQMRTISAALGVSCTHCHVGPEGAPLSQIDYAADSKRAKLVARQMMRLVQEVGRRLDTLPSRAASGPAVSCVTCHRGVAIPRPLSDIIAEAALTSAADSAVRAYNSLRARHFGRDAYDFGESTLNIAAYRVGRDGKPADALLLLDLNERQFPNASMIQLFRGNIQLMRRDTAAAIAAFESAIRRDSTNTEARQRLQSVRPRR